MSCASFRFDGPARSVAAGIALAACLVLPGRAASAPPLPPPRPVLEAPEPSPDAEPVEATAPDVVEGPSGTSCLARLARAGLKAEPAGDAGGGGACRIEEPIRLLGLVPPKGPPLGFADRPVVACRLAEGLAAWLGGIVSPVLTIQLGAPPTQIRTGPGFECRPRNRVAGAKMSAHGLGLAIDVAGFDLADRRSVSVAAAAPWAPALASIRTAACGWFTTVLGPGSDPYHASHLHLDVQQHGSSDRYRICQ